MKVTRNVVEKHNRLTEAEKFFVLTALDLIDQGQQMPASQEELEALSRMEQCAWMTYSGFVVELRANLHRLTA